MSRAEIIVGEGLRALPEPFCYSDIWDGEEMLLPCGASETYPYDPFSREADHTFSVGESLDSLVRAAKLNESQGRARMPSPTITKGSASRRSLCAFCVI